MKFVLLSSFLLFLGCEFSSDNLEAWKNIEYSYSEIKLDEPLPIESNFIRSYDFDGKSHLFLLDPHNHKLIIVDKKSGEIKNIDFRKRCFLNSKLSGFLFKDDTILLFHRLVINEVHYYEITNGSKGSIRLKNSDPFMENILIDSGTPIYYKDSEWKFLTVPDTFPFMNKYLMIDKRYNEKTKEEYSNLIEVPDYTDTIFLHESLPYRISIGDTIDYYSWGYSDSIIAIDQNQSVKKIFFGSKNSRKFTDSIIDEIHNYKNDFHYRQLIFDHHKNIFYRVALDLKKSVGKQKSLIAYSKNFNKLDEKFLPNEVLIDFYFVDTDGLHFLLSENVNSDYYNYRFLTVNPVE